MAEKIEIVTLISIPLSFIIGGVNYIKAFFLCLIVVVAIFSFINWIKVRLCYRVKDVAVPISRNDCFGDYKKAIRIIKKRLYATTYMHQDRSDLGFDVLDNIGKFYPAIAFFRLCHLAGYEVEIRPMREEKSPLEENEVVSRMSDEEWKQYTFLKKEDYPC